MEMGLKWGGGYFRNDVRAAVVHLFRFVLKPNVHFAIPLDAIPVCSRHLRPACMNDSLSPKVIKIWCCWIVTTSRYPASNAEGAEGTYRVRWKNVNIISISPV